MMAALAVGAIIVAVAFIVRRIVLRTEGSLPRRPSELFAVAFGRMAAPGSEPADPEATQPEPERPDVGREPGSATT